MYFFMNTFNRIDAKGIMLSSIFCLRVIVFIPGKNNIVSIMKGKRIIYRSWVYILKLANRILHKKAFCVCKLVSFFSTRACKTKNNDNKKKVIANPSSAPPLNSWEKVKNENLVNPYIRLKKTEETGDLRNKFKSSAIK